MASLLARRRGAKILNVGARMEPMDWPVVMFKEAMASMLKVCRSFCADEMR